MNYSLIVMIQLWLTSFADIPHTYLAEDNVINLFCPVNKSARFVEMSITMKTYSVPLIYCNINSCDTMIRQANVSVSAVGYNVTLKLRDEDLQPLRNITFLTCSYDSLIDIKYSISIVAKPVNSTCDLPILSQENGNLSLTCSTNRVFPPAKCFLIIDKSDVTLAGAMTYTHNEMNGSLVYYESQCTWTAQLSYFEAGFYNFDELILPNVTNDASLGQTVRVNLNFTLPSLAFSSQCYNGSNIIDGYIKPTASIYCICYLQAVGNPPAHLNWLDDNGLKVGTDENNTATSIFIC